MHRCPADQNSLHRFGQSGGQSRPNVFKQSQHRAHIGRVWPAASEWFHEHFRIG